MTEWFTTHAGEVAALSAAFIWSLASMIWAHVGAKVRPLELNLVKGVLAILMLLLTFLLTRQTPLPTSPLALILLLASGMLGVGLGDTAYFSALRRLGARRTLLVGTLSPPMAALLAWIFLGEKLSPAAWVGILITILGVAWVILERTPGEENGHTAIWGGVGFAMLANLAGAGGAVLSRSAFTMTDVSPLQSALVRISGGVVLLVIWLAIQRQPVGRWVQGDGPQLWKWILTATFLGTFLGIILQQTSLQLSAAGISQTLISTSPLFILPIAAATGEKISLRAVLGVFVAIIGVAILFQS